MARILLTRHGETEWNALGRLQGRTDVPLNDVGRDQARALATRLGDAGLTAVCTSSLLRARETGEIVANALGLAAPTVDDDLCERNFGVFEGLTRSDIETRYPEAWRDWGTRSDPPGGEARDDAIARFARAITRIAAAEGGTILVVSHGAVMRLWLIEVIGAAIPIVPNGASYVVERDGAGFRAELRA